MIPDYRYNELLKIAKEAALDAIMARAGVRSSPDNSSSDRPPDFIAEMDVQLPESTYPCEAFCRDACQKFKRQLIHDHILSAALTLEELKSIRIASRSACGLSSQPTLTLEGFLPEFMVSREEHSVKICCKRMMRELQADELIQLINLAIKYRRRKTCRVKQSTPSDSTPTTK